MDNIKLQRAQSDLPTFYAANDENSVIYALLNALTQVDEDRGAIITRVYGAIGIDKTDDRDLESRWGGLLGTKMKPTETYDQYRTRLKLIYPSLVGGTATAIKYAIASCLGADLSDENNVNNTVQVYDAWEYDKSVGYGNIIILVNSMLIPYDNMDAKIQEIETTVTNIKAAGINFYMVYKAFNPITYHDLDLNTYISLNDFTYNELS